MTNTAATNQRGHPQDTPIRAVLFDLSGTLLDEQYLHHGLVHLAAALHERWAIDPTVTRTRFMVAFRAVSQECADTPFYLMRNMICRALERLIADSGHASTRNELLHLEQLFWTAAIPTASPTHGAIGTLTRLHDVGIRTGIVSYADSTVFEALLKQTGLAGSTDVEVCSETARSCKPHPAIFHQALRAVGVDPTEAMFVGDTVATDVVGGNRIGMRTALLSAGEYTLDEGPNDDPESHPDHHIDSLLDVVDIVITTNRTAQQRNGRRSASRRRATFRLGDARAAHSGSRWRPPERLPSAASVAEPSPNHGHDRLPRTQTMSLIAPLLLAQRVGPGSASSSTRRSAGRRRQIARAQGYGRRGRRTGPTSPTSRSGAPFAGRELGDVGHRLVVRSLG
jgi:HAD superfamily hydrolase (TIGR01509 family)